MGDVIGTESVGSVDIKTPAKEALSKLVALREKTVAEQKTAQQVETHPVTAAIANLNFIKETLGPIVDETLVRADRSIKIGPRFHFANMGTDYSTVYSPVEHEVGYVWDDSLLWGNPRTSETMRFTPLTAEDIQGMWDANADRQLVNYLSGSREGFIDLFTKAVEKVSK